MGCPRSYTSLWNSAVAECGVLAASEQRKRARDRARKVHDTQSGFLRRARLRKEVTMQVPGKAL